MKVFVKSSIFLIALGSATLTLPSCNGSASPEQSSNQAPSTVVAKELTEPSAAANLSQEKGVVEINLTASATRVQLVDGKETDVFAYNNSIPGPTITATEGDEVIVHFKNDLPEPTTIHWHGLHIPADQDGNPMDPVPPGGQRDYRFKILANTAGTYWYHPHPMGLTANQVGKGLAGAFIVQEAKKSLPESVPEDTLILADNRFNADGSIATPAEIDRLNGREGDVVFVNGKRHTFLNVRAGEIRRFRILNASSSRYYRLQIPGHVLQQIGTDGGLIEKPIEMSELLLAPAERAEVLVRFDQTPGTTTELQSAPYDRGKMSQSMDAGPTPSPSMTMATGMGGSSAAMSAENAGANTITLLQIRYSEKSPIESPQIPTTLRKIEPISTSQATERSFALQESMMAGDFRINGRPFDPNRVDVETKLGATEIWSIKNEGDMDHPFHIHGFQFQVIDRNGVPESVVAWKDTVNLRKGETVRLALKFDDYPGLRMYHCHILDHEELGMMGVLKVDQ